MLTFAPGRGMILLCNYDLATVPPEMRKLRRVVVMSPRSYNKPPSMRTPGKCIVVPFSATEPREPRPSHHYVQVGRYASLTEPVWAICEMIGHVSHTRLDRVASGQRFLTETVSADDMAAIVTATRHALGFPEA